MNQMAKVSWKMGAPRIWFFNHNLFYVKTIEIYDKIFKPQFKLITSENKEIVRTIGENVGDDYLVFSINL